MITTIRVVEMTEAGDLRLGRCFKNNTAGYKDGVFLRNCFLIE